MFVPTPNSTLPTEQHILRISVMATVVIAVLGVGLGLVSGSVSILFDGMYALIDASMSVLALVVSRLIAKDSRGEMHTRRFLMGFWHLEPMVLAFNGLLLVSVSVYGLINAIGLILSGGNDLAFGWALVYAVLVLALSLFMIVYEMRANRQVKSSFVALDLNAWIMAGSITAALLIAFTIGILIKGTSLAWLVPYVDPLTLALVCAIIIPLPYQAIKRAISDMMLIAPPDLSNRTNEVAARIVERHGFINFTAYVARVGRSREIELCFVVPEDCSTLTIADCDSIRDEISKAIGDEGPHRWLTISFTTDPKWSL